MFGVISIAMWTSAISLTASVQQAALVETCADPAAL
jgi:hypothetical protein